MSGKMFRVLIIIILAISIAGGGALFFVLNASGEQQDPSKLSLEEMVEYSFQTEEMDTDLEDGSFVRIQFQVVTNNEKAKEEIEHRSFQFKNILIKELSTMDREAFKTGLTELEARMKSNLNEVMEEGKVIDVYTINKVLQ